MLLVIKKSFGTPVSILRPFNTYGPRQSNRAVIPYNNFTNNSGKRRLNWDLFFPTRDFNFVEDTCNAFKSLAKSDASIGRVINSASNFEISIEQTAFIIAEIMNVEIEIISDDNRIRPKDSEVSRLYGDNQSI